MSCLNLLLNLDKHIGHSFSILVDCIDPLHAREQQTVSCFTGLKLLPHAGQHLFVTVKYDFALHLFEQNLLLLDFLVVLKIH